MRRWSQILVSPDTAILEAIRIIDSVGSQIVIVVDEQGRLRGTVTDGDVRRGILRGVALTEPVETVMNRSPVSVSPEDGREGAFQLMRKRTHLRSLPVVADDGVVLGVVSIEDLLDQHERDNIVVLMAGGFGKRLRPLTDSVPKPLLKVGDKPVLERIVENLVGYGFRRLFLAVHYRAEMIERHFGDGSRWGAEIGYLREDTALGTAGALALLPEHPREPVLVANGDLVTSVNYCQLLEFHQEHAPAATMCVREYCHQVPFGVLKIRDHRIVEIEEKPVQRCLVNAGIYVLAPEVIEFIPDRQYFEMTDLFARLIEVGRETAVFPLREPWSDIGIMTDLERMDDELRGGAS